MPCCLNTGEAAGIAAAMSVNNTGDIHSIDTSKLRDKLKKYGGYLPDMNDC